MPTEPPDFDCRNPVQVLRLRFRDWMWPTALAIAVAIPFLGQSNGTYRIGSVTYYANTYGPSIFLAAIVFAAARWYWIGRLRPFASDRCPRCGYSTTGLDAAGSAVRCPECGTEAGPGRSASQPARFRERFRAAPISRLLLDLPSVVAAGFVAWVLVVIGLIVFGVVDD